MLVCISLLTWNCQKEELEKGNTFEGRLFAGIDMSTEALADCPIVLGKLLDQLPEDADVTDISNLVGTRSGFSDENGFFSIDSLPDGKYIVLAGEGFEFSDKPYDVFELKGEEVLSLNKTINRIPVENNPKTYTVNLANAANSFNLEKTDCSIDSIVFFEGNTLIGKVGPFGKNRSSEFDIELDKKKNPTYEVHITNNGNEIITQRFEMFFPDEKSEILSNMVEVDGHPYCLYFKKGWCFGHYFGLKWVFAGGMGMDAMHI